MYKIIILTGVITLFACGEEGITEISHSDKEIADAFASSKISEDGQWRASNLKVNDPERFMYDYTTSDPTILRIPSPGPDYILKLHNQTLVPEEWEKEFEFVQQEIKKVINSDQSPAAKLMNLEMLGFPLIREYLLKVENNKKLVESTASILEILLKYNTMGETEMLANILIKIEPSLANDEFHEIRRLIVSVAKENIENSNSSTYRVEQSKNALSLLQVDD